MEWSEDTIKEQDKEEFHGSDWENPVACHIEELLTKNLSATLCSAVKKIVESGYTKEVAERAILLAPCSMVAEPSRVDYTLLEMICVLREVRPSLSVSETMWRLLISDLSLVQADGGTVRGSCSQEASGDCQALPQAKDYYSSIRFDETLQEYIVEDIKDEAIRILVPHKCTIEKELQGWTEWANEKVMQAAQRLGKDRAELKMFRQEKEEKEKLKKEKQALVDSTVKQLLELEYAMTNATGQIQVDNCTIARLKEENALLMNDMEAANMQAMRVATNLHSATEREQETLRKMQSLDADKAIIQDQLTELKHQIAALNNRLEKARGRKDQFKFLPFYHFRHCGSRRRRRTQKPKMKLESEKSKIAAFNLGFPRSALPNASKRLAVFQGKFCEAPDVKPERECIVCLSNEIAVVFIPCAHQVLCAQCNLIHEKQGMTDCPSCRTAIQKRVCVCVSYRPD
ncbi:hypothetical protein SASPL_112494 [Salvia splendens]|uniref:RING-type domain-containing protein n=1 Tax=Salvia splendens TaxID=180675 RepID=A0A8X8Y957_SALSN|nr:hypothetical protein SASPL_112494 [Salvia splendens]